MQQLLKDWENALIIESINGIRRVCARLYGFRVSAKPGFLRRLELCMTRMWQCKYDEEGQNVEYEHFDPSLLKPENLDVRSGIVSQLKKNESGMENGNAFVASLCSAPPTDTWKMIAAKNKTNKVWSNPREFGVKINNCDCFAGRDHARGSMKISSISTRLSNSKATFPQ